MTLTTIRRTVQTEITTAHTAAELRDDRHHWTDRTNTSRITATAYDGTTWHCHRDDKGRHDMIELKMSSPAKDDLYVVATAAEIMRFACDLIQLAGLIASSSGSATASAQHQPSPDPAP